MKFSLRLLLTGAIAAVLAVALGLPLSARQASTAPLFDNERVTVFDQKLPAPSPANKAHDVVVVTIGKPGAESAAFVPKGAAASAPAAGVTRAIVVELKDRPVPPLPNKSGKPLAFPRPGSKQLFDNARVTVWDYTWTSGVATPVHFHDKDVVVLYLADGELKSTTPDGKFVLNPHTYGFTKFNPRDRVHTETLVKGAGRAIIVELK